MQKKTKKTFQNKPKKKAKHNSKKYKTPVLASYNQLLSDVAEIFNTSKKKYLSSGHIIKYLAADKSKPWCKYRKGKRISRSILNRILLRCGIFKFELERNNHTEKLYHVKQFAQYQQPAALSAVS